MDHLTTWIAAQQHVTNVTGLTRVPATPDTPTSSTGHLIALYSSGNYRHVPALARFVSSVAVGDTALIVTQSNTTLESDQGKALIEHLRADAPAVSQGLDIRVGGLQALRLDLDSALYRNFPRTILVILATTYLLLLLMFRSVLLPLKAILMNTLSVGATYGALVYIFQWGNLGFPRVAFIDAIIPILLFCVLFGLSMDYEVFLLSRIREEWLQTKDNRAAVASGTGEDSRSYYQRRMPLRHHHRGIHIREPRYRQGNRCRHDSGRPGRRNRHTTAACTGHDAPARSLELVAARPAHASPVRRPLIGRRTDRRNCRRTPIHVPWGGIFCNPG